MTLSHCIQFNLLGHETMTKALELCPWIEIALRRLFGILYLENAVSQGQGTVSRSAAWYVAKSVLEVHPATIIRVPALDSILAKEASAIFKELNDLRYLVVKSLGNRGGRGKNADQNKGVKGQAAN